MNPVSAKLTVTLVVGQHTIELSEEDAKAVLAALKRMFPEPSSINSRNPFRDIPKWTPTLTTPIPAVTYDPRPIDPSKIYCSTSRVKE